MGVTLDSIHSLDPHINNIVKNCTYHLQALRHIRPSIIKEVANTMACAIIGSRLDYCNSMFYKMSDKNFNKLQRIQNCAARIVCGVGRRTQNARQLCHNLHWLPVYSRTDFKLAFLCFESHVMRQPDYLAVTLDRYEPSHILRSSTQHFLSVQFCNTVFVRQTLFFGSCPTSLEQFAIRS